jgi:putative phosphoesterase
MPTIGVISDTHGLLRPEALTALAGADLILHAGDIGAPEILSQLAALAPLVAVRGNNDRGPWATAIPERAEARLGGVRLYVLHDLHELDLDPAAAGYDAVVAGHSHRPACERRGEVLYFNPGSAGPRRFRLPVSIGRLYIEGASKEIRGELITLLP